MERAELQNSEIEKEIEAQFKIYQENEIYTKAVDKINKSEVELSAEIYNAYLKHIDEYNKSIYSFEKNSKLPEPNSEDFVLILNTLIEIDKKQKEQKNSNTHKTKSSKANSSKTEKKVTTRKKKATQELKSPDIEKDETKKVTKKSTSTKNTTKTSAKSGTTKKVQNAKTEKDNTKVGISKSKKTTTKK